jgi:predicted RNA-binding protein YlqC (UPF0109 family)
MNTVSNPTEELLRDLVSRFVDHPDALEIAHQVAEGSTYFVLKPHLEDEGRLIGSSGSHVRALSFFVASLGRAHRTKYTFRLLTAGEPQTRRREELDVLKHDPEPSFLLLERILDAFRVEDYDVGVSPGSGERDSLTFVFAVKVSVAWYDFFTVPGRDNPMTIAAALGTLFRAIAKKAGVRYQINFEKR